MKVNLILRLTLLVLIGSFILVPVACGSDDSGGGIIKIEDPIADPTNAATTIAATSPILADGIATSTVTVTIADTKGNRFTTSAGTVSLSTTGSAAVSAVTDNGDGSYSATVTNTTAETVTISGSLGSTAITDTADITFDPVPIEDMLVIAINSGGEQVDIDTVTFVKDTLFVLPSQAFANDMLTDIMGTEADTLYVSERSRGASLGTIGYSIPVDSAEYEIKLHFAEIYWGLDGQGGAAGGAGSRVFDVIVEDSLILDDYDIFADVGAATATIKMHETMVVDDTLNVVLTASVDQPKISALEVIKKGDN